MICFYSKERDLQFMARGDMLYKKRVVAREDTRHLVPIFLNINNGVASKNTP